MKIYTKTGDKGETSLADGARVSKRHIRVEAYGSIDETNSFVGLVVSAISIKSQWEPIKKELIHIQNLLFNISSHLACGDDKKRQQLPAILPSDVEFLEKRIDFYTEHLKPLDQFILPGGSSTASYLHVARTVCRRAERVVINLHEQYPQEIVLLEMLNRLSDYFFVLARYANLLEGEQERMWKK